MNKKNSNPGVNRDERISDEGLLRLEKHLKSGAKISTVVLSQWVRRYGDAARVLIKENGQYNNDLDSGTN